MFRLSHLAAAALLVYTSASPVVPNAADNATAVAVIYAYPIIQYADTFDSVLSSTGANTVFSESNTATAQSAALVRPNVDTLYSKIAVDLSSVDVALTVPEVPDDRFYVFPFYDLWSNNYVNLGSLQSTAPGKYLLQLAKEESAVGFKACTAGSEYQGIINVPTIYSIVLPRILLKNHGADVQAVNKIQAGIKVEEVLRAGCTIAPKLTEELLNGSSLKPMAEKEPSDLTETQINTLLEVTARIFRYNKPLSTSEASSVDKILKAAGLSNGHYAPPASLNYSMASLLMGEALIATEKLLVPWKNEWAQFEPAASGSFHTHYAARAQTALTGYLQLVESEALYPGYIGSGIQGLSLGPDEAYIFTFPSGKPQVQGFWSLTAYNSSSYLIPNTLDRYSLGDRSNLTYPDGQLIYGNSECNDPFSLLVQPAHVKPNSNWTSNWLPAPAGGGNFTVNLRFYGPDKSMFPNGSYVFPIVAKQGAIKG